jgi:hypothetical protein
MALCRIVKPGDRNAWIGKYGNVAGFEVVIYKWNKDIGKLRGFIGE